MEKHRHNQINVNDYVMKEIAKENGFKNLPSKIEFEAKRIKEKGIVNKDYDGRRDFRQTLTFTIDPEDAKDFDDAVSFKEMSEGKYEIGIHIADVSHYVAKGSALDRESHKRGTSVYLVDRVIPMLPEVLSNDLCSLVPGKDRLTMSAVFILDRNANVLSEWYGKTVIHSHKRFTYEEAEHSIKNETAHFHKELHTLNTIAKKLTRDRFANGAFSLDQVEVRFVLDKNAVPIKIIKKERGDSNKLIEEFMLLANKKVAEVISKDAKKAGVFVYRVHDLPTKEKTDDLVFFLQKLGHKVKTRNGIIPASEINRILESAIGSGEEDTIHRMIVRSMAKAIYSTKNIGHYGLAFKYYTHFTSPIRRYPDIVVHRLLQDHLEKKHIGKEKLYEYEEISRRSSEQEKKAADAERASIKYKQAEYMSYRIGKIYDGIVSGVTEWGIYVEEKETKCEGLVKVRDLNDDYYIFNEKHMELVGQRRKKRYRLGNKVKIKVKRVDLGRRIIDYTLA